MDRITISRSDCKNLIELLSRGADIIYVNNPTVKEQNIARRMRMIRSKIERKIK